MAKHPRLQRRGAVYHFRAKVPVDLLAEYAPKREVTFSLRTKDPAEALLKVRVEGVKFDQEVARRRRLQALEPRAALAEAEIERLVAGYMHERLKEDEEHRLDQTGAEEAYHEAVRAALSASGVPFVAAF